MGQWWNEPFINRRDYILDHVEDLALTSEECMAILLIDFMNQHNIPVSHGILAAKMKLEAAQIDNLLANLSTKGYLSIIYRDKKVVFVIDGIFESTQSKTMDFDQSLFDVFEREFARPLSQLELQRMSEWMGKYDQRLIVYALREAVLYDKRSFDYIERILIEWKKRNLTVQEYEEGKR